MAPVDGTADLAVEAVLEDEPVDLVAEVVPVGGRAGPAVEAVPPAQVVLVEDPEKAVAEGSGHPGSRAWCPIAQSSTVPSAMNGATTVVSTAGAPLAPNDQSVPRGARLREQPV